MPDYYALHSLVVKYGLKPVDKVEKGGALWFASDENDRVMRAFVEDSGKIGYLDWDE